MTTYFQNRQSLASLLGMLVFSLSVVCQSTTPKGFINFNGYYDLRGYSNLSINTLLIFNRQFSYFGTINHFSTKNNGDMSVYYHEHQAFYSPFKKLPIDATLCYATKSGENNDALRLGVRFRIPEKSRWTKKLKKIGFNAFANLYLLDFSTLQNLPLMNQMQYVYQWDFPIGKNKDLMYLRGFANQYFDWHRSGQSTWVTEHQMGIRIHKGFHTVVEYRHNEFAPKCSGLAFGLEYFVNL